MKRKGILIGAVLVILLLLVLCSTGPVMQGADGLSEEYREAIRSQAMGVYSSKLPLVPVKVSVDEIKEDRVFYTIHYFPFGTVGMSFSENDGYNTEKYLSRLQ